jgi:hypothetical protein
LQEFSSIDRYVICRFGGDPVTCDIGQEPGWIDSRGEPVTILYLHVFDDFDL